MRRALAARSHRYSVGRAHVAGTHLRYKKSTKKPTACVGLMLFCLGRVYCETKPGGSTSSPVIVAICRLVPVIRPVAAVDVATKL